MIMYIVACLSPATRLFPAMCARLGGRAGWVGVPLGAAAIAALAGVFALIFKNAETGPRCLSDALTRAFGAVLGRVIIGVYFIWTALLFTLHIRYYAERMLATIFTTADIRFFMLTMLPLVYMAVRGRLEVFARFSEISALLFTIVLLALALCLLPAFDPANILPVTHMDALPALKSSVPPLSTFGYMTLFFFLGEQISNKRDAGGQGRRAALYLGIMLTLVTVICIGTLSPSVAERMPRPFFSSTKLITVLQPLDRFEALLLSEWVISDFIIITAFALILISTSKRLFGVSRTPRLAAPVVFLGFVGGIFIAADRFELEMFSYSVFALATNTALGFGVPILTLITGKLRKTI